MVYTDSVQVKLGHLFCMSVWASCMLLGEPEMLMILSMEPGFGSVMTMSHDDWLLKCDHRTVTGYDVTRNTNHMQLQRPLDKG